MRKKFPKSSSLLPLAACPVVDANFTTNAYQSDQSLAVSEAGIGA